MPLAEAVIDRLATYPTARPLLSPLDLDGGTHSASDDELIIASEASTVEPGRNVHGFKSDASRAFNSARGVVEQWDSSRVVPGAGR